MAEPTYLYGYGRKRHILDGELDKSWRGRPETSGRAHCGMWGDTEAAKREEQRWWSMSDEVADRRIAKMRAFPICKICEKARDHENPEDRP